MATEGDFNNLFCFLWEILTVKVSSSLGAGTAGAETESAFATGTPSVGSLLTFVSPCEL
jgi:hypothetical protein